MTSIFQTTYSNEFSLIKMYGFPLKFHWSLFLGILLTLFHIGSDNCLQPARWQAMISTNAGGVTTRLLSILVIFNFFGDLCHHIQLLVYIKCEKYYCLVQCCFTVNIHIIDIIFRSGMLHATLYEACLWPLLISKLMWPISLTISLQARNMQITSVHVCYKITVPVGIGSGIN